MSLCPCNSGATFEVCCGPLIAGQPAPTAEALMRSRFTAYTKKNVDYIERTCTDAARDDFNRLDAERYADSAQFLKLTIIRTVDGGTNDETGMVEFSFQYKMSGQTLFQHELSNFVRVNGEWRYSGSDINPRQETVRKEHNVGRNDPCPCGSGKKYKKCCGTNG